MELFFAKDFPGEPFELLGTPHLIALFCLLAVNLFFFYVRSKEDNQKIRIYLRYGMAGILIINEMLWHLWNFTTGQWSIQTMLPLHLCSVFVFLNSFMLITKNYTIFEVAYFLGIGGAIQTMLTPDIGLYNFPHFRYFQVFLSHGFIISSTIYMAAVEGFRPYPKSILRTILITNIYALFVGLINFSLNSNYLFICRPPDTPSLIDLLGPWPQYLIALEGIAILTCLVLYIPYFIHDHLPARLRLRISN